MRQNAAEVHCLLLHNREISQRTAQMFESVFILSPLRTGKRSAELIFLKIACGSTSRTRILLLHSIIEMKDVTSRLITVSLLSP